MILDTPRTYKRPTEEVARAIWHARELATEPRLRRLEPDAFDMASGAFALVMRDATAALIRLRALGFLSPLAIDALKAESLTTKQVAEKRE